LHASFDELSAPDDPGIEGIVDSIHSACEWFEASADSFATGIDNLDPAAISRSTEEMSNSAALLGEATSQIEGYSATG
jgi:hypothetical protein